MKRILIISFFTITSVICLISSCTKKSSTTSSTTTSTPTSVASPSVNTTINIGGAAGWSYDGCFTTPNALGAWFGSTRVQLFFGGTSMPPGTYTLTPGTPLAGQARLILTDPPGQPSGFLWYSSSGLQTVNVFTAVTNNTIAVFSNIICTQSMTPNPIVTATGTMLCF